MTGLSRSTSASATIVELQNPSAGDIVCDIDGTSGPGVAKANARSDTALAPSTRQTLLTNGARQPFLSQGEANAAGTPP
ncbi:MAG TPA: hypothetical protein DGB72_11580 [Gemmatimonadetes bacterium]|nr:hypothetical protein [Gemmatimonadota bacterium]